MKKVAVFLANGVEESEAIVQIDLLRRAGIEVRTFSVEAGLTIESAHKIKFQADDLLENINPDKYDMLFIPGGSAGVKRLYEVDKLNELLTAYAQTVQAGKGAFAAVCAGPTVLGKLGLLDGKAATCAAGWDKGLGKAKYSPQAVVKDGAILTGQGLGASIPLALACIEFLIDKDTADDVARSIAFNQLQA